MTVLKFEKFELDVIDYLYDDIYVGCDIKMDPNYLINEFLPYVHEYIEKRYPLEISIADDSFEGYLGNYTFDTKGNVRLWLVKEYIETSKNKLTDMTVSRYSVQYLNLVKYVRQHEVKINKLVKLLKSKNVIDESEAQMFNSDFQIFEDDIDFNHEVTDLNEFLSYTDERLNDIRSRRSL